METVSPHGRTQTEGVWEQMMRRIFRTEKKDVTEE
jgi:hypothetical protein